MARRLASKVTVYTNGANDLGEQLVSGFATDIGIKVDDRPIIRLEKGPTEPKVIVHFADGLSITEGFLVCVKLFFSPMESFARSLLSLPCTPLARKVYTHGVSGPQTPDGGQWVFCASTFARINRAGGYQNHSALLRKQRPWSFCNRRLQHAA